MSWIGEDVDAARTQFLALVAEIRGELHRYCARMTGSVADGEDVVQDTLARAFFELPQLESLPPLRPWLFRIAHNRCIDLARRYDRRMSEALDDEHVEPSALADEELARRHAVTLAVSRFVELPPAQRSSVILRDVLGYTTEETAALTSLTLVAVKSALRRGRLRLVELSAQPPVEVEVSPLARRYVQLFNAHDWDGVRALLVEDVELDLISRYKRSGRRDVGTYFTNYASISGWQLAVLEGDLLVMTTPTARYPVALTTVHDGVARIRDYRYVPYMLHDL
jgi:RNA polymerase sigma factor (sigma-70 family)